MSTVNFNNLMKEFSNFKQSTENMQNKDKYLKEEKEFFDFFNEYCDYIAEPAHGIIPASTTEMEKLIKDIKFSVSQKRSKICKSKETSEIKARRKSRLGSRPPTLTTIKKEKHIEKFIEKIENLEKSYSENESFFKLLLSDIGEIKEEKSDKNLYKKIKELDTKRFNSVKHENDDGNVFNESWSVICGAIHKSAEQEPKSEEEWKKFREEILVLLEVAGNKAKKFQTDYQKQIKVKM